MTDPSRSRRRFSAETPPSYGPKVRSATAGGEREEVHDATFEGVRGGDMVHVVTAVIKPHRLDSVRESLLAIGIQGMTITEVKGFGRQGGKTETYRGAEYTIDFLPKLKVEVVCDTSDADKVIDTIADAARTGQIGDGKIWAQSLDRLVRIRTGERESEAL
jgi:nitrogen regulatory protein PII